MENLKRVITLAREMGVKDMTIGVDGMTVSMNIDPNTAMTSITAFEKLVPIVNLESDNSQKSCKLSNIRGHVGERRTDNEMGRKIRRRIGDILSVADSPLTIKDICRIYNSTAKSTFEILSAEQIRYHAYIMNERGVIDISRQNDNMRRVPISLVKVQK
jgi:hypothetical protein